MFNKNDIFFEKCLLYPYEEKVCFYRFIRKKCVVSAHKLILANLVFVARISIGFSGYGVVFSDLLHEGIIGFIKSLLCYNPEYNVKFHTFALIWIRYEILNYVKKQQKTYYRQSILQNKGDVIVLSYYPYDASFMINPNRVLKNCYYFRLYSALEIILPIMRTIIYSRYFFLHPLTLQELSLVFELPIETIRRIEQKTINDLRTLIS